jgi:hypothetical protein
MDDDEQAWRDLLQRMSLWVGIRFALGTSAEKEIWQFIIGAAAHLEDLAVMVLWLDEGPPGIDVLTWTTASGRAWTLGRATRELESRNLVGPDSTRRLKGIADLRNKVVHRGATDGVPWIAEYAGRPVFRDIEALRQLEEDVNRTTEELRERV